MKNDLISKQAVEEIIMEYRDEQADKLEEIALERAYGANAVGKLISELPTVEPIKGEWIKMNYDLGFECSQCGWESDAPYDFCPNCGTKMIWEE